MTNESTNQPASTPEPAPVESQVGQEVPAYQLETTPISTLHFVGKGAALTEETAVAAQPTQEDRT